MRTTTLLLVLTLWPVSAAAQYAIPPTPCYDRQCRKDRASDVKVKAREDARALSGDVESRMTFRTERMELQPLAVAIPKPPYGVVGNGQCLVRFSLERDGSVSDVAVSRCPDAYSVSIREAAGGWRYSPVLDDEGEAMRVRAARLVLPWSSYQTNVTTAAARKTP